MSSACALYVRDEMMRNVKKMYADVKHAENVPTNNLREAKM